MFRKKVNQGRSWLNSIGSRDAISERRQFWLAVALVALVFAMRAAIFYMAPFFLSEDSDAYAARADYLSGGEAKHVQYLGYRQLGYPGLIAALQIFTTHPFFLLITLQITLSSLGIFFLFRACQNIGLRWWSALVAMVYIGFNIRENTYTLVVAPEALIEFFQFLSLYILSIDMRALRLGRPPLGGLVLRLLGQAFILGYLGMIKEVFLPFGALVYTSYFALGFFYRNLLLRRWQALSALAVSVLLLCAIAVGSSYINAQILGSNRLRPMCFCWALSLTYRYMDFDSPLHSELKSQVRPYVIAAREELSDLSRSYKLGTYKVNESYGDKTP